MEGSSNAMGFADLIQPMCLVKGRDDFSAPEVMQRRNAEQISELLANAGFESWSPIDGAMLTPGFAGFALRIVIGYVTWSEYDLRFLDQMQEYLPRVKSANGAVELFCANNFLSLKPFEERIPGLGQVFQTPVVGVWRFGQQIAAWQGAHARANTQELLQDLTK